MNLTSRKLITPFFLFIELVLFALIMTTTGTLLQGVSYGAIALCFLYALLFCRSAGAFHICALACTLCADYFLVLCTPIQQLWGMVFFLGAQMLYALKLHRTLGQKWVLCLRLGLSAAAIIVCFAVLGSKTDALAVISVCYYANLIMNIIAAAMQFRKHALMCIGFVLFILCDTVIGLQVAANGYLNIPSDSVLLKILYPGFNLSWMFYLPSQVLLSLSCAFHKKEA